MVCCNPNEDILFSKPYIDLEEQRLEPVSHLYMHGGFEGSDLKFSFYFPSKEQYQGRFFQMLTPVQGSEMISQTLSGEEDNISFAITHGAYFVESNMGGDTVDANRLYCNNAAAAMFSKQIAQKLFGSHRTYGYVYGGSGGAFKTIGCVQNTEGIWDGSVPFVPGHCMAMPNNFTVRAHAMRILRGKFEEIVDALDPGGNGDPCATLDEEQQKAFEEVTGMGFPPQMWFAHDVIGDGALPLLTYAVDQCDPSYYEDFWEKPGYLGADPKSSVHRDLIHIKTTITGVTLAKQLLAHDKLGVDDAWKTHGITFDTPPEIELEHIPEHTEYYAGLTLKLGDISLPIRDIKGHTAVIGTAFGLGNINELLQEIKIGQEVWLDNRNYLAIQTYHRHQLPDEHFLGWDMFRHADGTPGYPQRPLLTGPILAQNATGSVQNGLFCGKMIIMASLMDESAFAWNASWYRNLIQRTNGEDANTRVRLWYQEHAVHSDIDIDKPGSQLRIISYRGALNQALLDLADWVENGIEPACETTYEIVNGQVTVPPLINQRGGIQPTVQLSVNGVSSYNATVGEQLSFQATIQLSEYTGGLTQANFDLEGHCHYDIKAKISDTQDGVVLATTTHSYQTPGTYFPVIRIASNRQGYDDTFTQIYNLSRVRVTVE